MSTDNSHSNPIELTPVYQDEFHYERAKEDLYHRHDPAHNSATPIPYIDIGRMSQTFAFSRAIDYVLDEEEVKSWENEGNFFATVFTKSTDLVEEFLRTDHPKTLEIAPAEAYPILISYVREGGFVPWITCIIFNERTFMISSALASEIYYPQFRNLNLDDFNEKSKEALKVAEEIYKAHLRFEPHNQRTNTPFFYPIGSEYAPEGYFEEHYPGMLEEHKRLIAEKRKKREEDQNAQSSDGESSQTEGTDQSQDQTSSEALPESSQGTSGTSPNTVESEGFVP